MAGDNYTIDFTGAAFGITRATVTVKATDQTKRWNTKDPDLTWTAEGLVNGDTADVLEVSISREEGEEAGKAYTITPSGKEIQGNYIVKYETGKLTISDKETYLIKFVNDDGTELQNGYVAEGDEPKYEDGTFRPGEAATRAEIAKAIRAFQEKVAE